MAVRAAFVAAYMVLPVQYNVRARLGEPYPALFMPGFGGAGSNLREGHVAVRREFVVTGRDQRRHAFMQLEFMDFQPSGHHSAVTSYVFPVPNVPVDEPKPPRSNTDEPVPWRHRVFPSLGRGRRDRGTERWRRRRTRWLFDRAAALGVRRPVSVEVVWHEERLHADGSGTVVHSSREIARRSYEPAPDGSRMSQVRPDSTAEPAP